jgi:FAD-linked sulfhydryl oxidase
MIITPEIWGPHGWKFIHMVALAYPVKPTEEEKLHYYSFFMSLANILPCNLCRDHYKKNLLKYPLNDVVLASRETLVSWTINIHNEVNISNNKPIVDYASAIKLIINNYNSEETKKLPVIPSNDVVISPIKDESKDELKQNSSMLYLLFIIFISLIVIAVLYKKL